MALETCVSGHRTMRQLISWQWCTTTAGGWEKANLFGVQQRRNSQGQEVAWASEGLVKLMDQVNSLLHSAEEVAQSVKWLAHKPEDPQHPCKD